MKRILLISLVVSNLLFAADVGGRWDGRTEMKNGNGEPVVVHLLLKQEGTKLRFEVPQKADAVVSFELALSGETLDGTARFQGPNGPQEIKISFHHPPAR